MKSLSTENLGSIVVQQMRGKGSFRNPAAVGRADIGLPSACFHFQSIAIHVLVFLLGEIKP